MTEDQVIKKAMSILGSKKTPKKARASRRNGLLGGRKRRVATGKPNG